MKNKFEEPKLTIILFSNDDIITKSGGFGDTDGEWYDNPDPDPDPAP